MMSKWQQSYVPLEKISKNIYKAQHKTTGKTIIIKKVSFSSISPKKKQHIVNEVNTLLAMDYIHLLKYLDFQINKKDVTVDIAIEYCNGGNVQDYISKQRTQNKKIQEDLIWRIFYQLVQAIDQIHRKNIIHRNINPTNIYFKQAKKVNVKLGGFSLAKKIDNQDLMDSTLLPQTYYYSPEQIQTGFCTRQTDIWALGCLIYELCTLQSPFKHPNSFERAKMIKETRPKKAYGYSTELNRLIFWCLQKNPQDRPTLQNLKSSPEIILRIKNRIYNQAKLDLQKRQAQLLRRQKELQQKENEWIKEQKLKKRFETLRKRSSEISVQNITTSKHENDY